MRREFEELKKMYPDRIITKKNIFQKLILSYRKLKVDIFLSRTIAGSESWHRLQQKISFLSTADVDMDLRSYFYEKSLKKCTGEFDKYL